MFVLDLRFSRGQPKGCRMNPAVLERFNGNTPFAREARFQFFEYVTSHEVMAATDSVCINMASLFFLQVLLSPCIHPPILPSRPTSSRAVIVLRDIFWTPIDH